MFLKFLSMSFHQECVLENDYFVEFSKILEKHCNFKTFAQQQVSNTKYVLSRLKHGNNLIVFLIHIS